MTPTTPPPPSSPPRPPRPILARAGSVLTATAVALAAAAGLAWLAVLSGLLTLFGAGAVVAAALVVVGVAALVRRRALGRWMLLPLLALAVPVVAVSASGFQVEPQRGVRVHAPRTPAEIPAGGYRTGLGEQLVDLRRLRVPDGRTVRVAARSDLARTVVALPRSRCFSLDVRWRTGHAWLPGVEEHPLVLGLGPARDALRHWAGRERDDGVSSTAFGRIAIFGRVHVEDQGRWTRRAPDPRAPTLRIDLRSEGSSFAVRDYPDDVGPIRDVTWPLDLNPPATPAQLRASWSSPRRSRSAARAWRRYRQERRAFETRAASLMHGSCVERQEAR